MPQVEALEANNLALDETNLALAVAVDRAEARQADAERAAEVATSRLADMEVEHAAEIQHLQVQIQVGTI